MPQETDGSPPYTQVALKSTHSKALDPAVLVISGEDDERFHRYTKLFDIAHSDMTEVYYPGLVKSLTFHNLSEETATVQIIHINLKDSALVRINIPPKECREVHRYINNDGSLGVCSITNPKEWVKVT